jgi:hypothetical protein
MLVSLHQPQDAGDQDHQDDQEDPKGRREVRVVLLDA